MEEAPLAWGAACLAGVGALAALRLRKRLPARVRCWCCGGRQWVPHAERDSWACQRCDQRNGFDEDGDYNVAPDTRTVRRVAYARRGDFGPTVNGLCKKCNSNQQLKVFQLASFVPTSEKKFDGEVEAFRSHLEKMYRLCSKCKKYLKHKLASEKELHLKSKLIGSRPKQKSANKSFDLKSFAENLLLSTLKALTIVSLLIIALDVCLHLDLFVSKNVIGSTKKHFYDTYKNTKSSVLSYCDAATICNETMHNVRANLANASRVTEATAYLSLIKEKCLQNLPTINVIVAIFGFSIAGGIVNFLLHLVKFRLTYRSVWELSLRALIFYNAKAGIRYLLPMQFILLLVMLLNLPNNKVETSPNRSDGKLKRLRSSTTNQSDEDSEELLSDDDSEPETYSNYNPRRANSVRSSSTYRTANTYTTNRTLHQYSNSFCPIKTANANGFDSSHHDRRSLTNRSFDCELDRSINDLNLGHRRMHGRNDSFEFATRRYDPSSPGLFHASPASLRSSSDKFVLSPSRFVHGHQQSWVAGGYWGCDSPRKPRSGGAGGGEGSSSSSQSSGFESQTSRNVESFPPSREGSVCSELNFKPSDSRLDASFRGSLRDFSAPLQSPVFPRMKPNEAVVIPGAPLRDGYFQNRFQSL